MADPGDKKWNDLHTQMVELVADYANPVASVSEVMSDARINTSKPTAIRRLNDLVEWGKLERKPVGPAHVYWPAGKYDDMREKIETLEEKNDRLSWRAEELEDELESVHEELESAREEVRAVREGELISPNHLFMPSFPTPLPDDLENRWRSRAAVWRRLASRFSVLLLFVTALLLVFVSGSSFLVNAGILPVDMVDPVLAFIALIWLFIAGGGVFYGLGYFLAGFALRSQGTAKALDPPTWKSVIIQKLSDSSGDEPDSRGET